MTKYRIAVVDSYRLMVESMSLALDAEEDFDIACQVFSEDEQEKVCHTDIDLIVLGSNLSNFGELGTQAQMIPRLQECTPGSKILLTVRAENPLSELVAALQAGADGCITTQSSFQELLDAARQVLSGKDYLPVGLGAKLIKETRTEEPSPLSIREISILSGLAYGHTNQEIAERLALSVRTVEAHRAAVLSKLGLGSRSEIVSYAIEHGLMGETTDWPH